MSDDLELLFMAPVSTRAVFAVKSLVVAGSSSITVLIFIFLPALFYGLLFGAGPLFYFWAVLASLGLWASGTAAAELLNLLVMRIVPPHRSREAVGVLGGLCLLYTSGPLVLGDQRKHLLQRRFFIFSRPGVTVSLLGSMIPVSYTHLDVYKRQI